MSAAQVYIPVDKGINGDTTVTPRKPATMFGGDPNMARRRGQRTGYLYRKGPSWILRWREDAIGVDGALARIQFARAIAPAEGPRKQTKKQAERIAWEEVLSKLDQATVYPQSLCTVSEFIEKKFLPEWVWSLKPAGKKHYELQLMHVADWYGKFRCTAGHRFEGRYLKIEASKHVKGMQRTERRRLCPLCGAAAQMADSEPLREVTTQSIQQAVKAILERGLSTQTAQHFRTTVSAIFRHAAAIGWYHSVNPAAAVRMPEMVRKPSRALTVAQMQALLARLESPARQMVFLSATSSLNVAEMSALKWQNVNLTNGHTICEGEALEPYCLAVRHNYYAGKLSSTKAGSRRRTIPLSRESVALLEQLKRASKYQAPGDYVFTNLSGGPVNQQNIRKRELQPAAKAAGIPFALGWHTFRHTCATLAAGVGMDHSDRKALLGHSSDAMTFLYTHSDNERRRVSIEAISTRLLAAPEKTN